MSEGPFCQIRAHLLYGGKLDIFKKSLAYDKTSHVEFPHPLLENRVLSVLD